MKMENEIAAPQAGIVDTVQVVKGAAVNSGDLLVTLNSPGRAAEGAAAERGV
jgi:biotin carboxyl carrier protein